VRTWQQFDHLTLFELSPFATPPHSSTSNVYTRTKIRIQIRILHLPPCQTVTPLPSLHDHKRDRPQIVEDIAI
jgi:hypothetical protein